MNWTNVFNIKSVLRNVLEYPQAVMMFFLLDMASVHTPRNLLSLCSLLLLLNTRSTMKTMEIATRMQMIVTIILSPSLPCLFSWLGSTVFGNGAIVPGDRRLSS